MNNFLSISNFMILAVILTACSSPNLVQPVLQTQTPFSVASEPNAITLPVTQTPTVLIPTPTAILLDQAYITLAGGDIDNVNVRSGPGVTFPQVGLLKPGDKARALGQTDEADWIYIEFSGTPQGKGWVNSAFVKLSGGYLPVINPITNQAATLSPTTDPQLIQQKAVETIKLYLKQDNLQYQYLGEGSNLNNFNHPNQRVGRYQVGNAVFSVDIKTNLMVEIDNTQGISFSESGKTFTKDELEQKARSLIAELAPRMNLQLLVSEKNNKGSNYFFRWTDRSTLGFVQVGYSQDGQLLNYVNSIEAGQ